MYVCIFLFSIGWKKIVRNGAGGKTFCFVMWLRFTYWRLNNIKHSKKNNKLFAGKMFLVALFSSNINEGIKVVLSFKRKDFTRTKSTKTQTSEQKQKRQRFYALKKHLRGTKLLIRSFAFLCFLCAFCAFLCAKQKRQRFYGHKNM